MSRVSVHVIESSRATHSPESPISKSFTTTGKTKQQVNALCEPAILAVTGTLREARWMLTIVIVLWRHDGLAASNTRKLGYDELGSQSAAAETVLKITNCAL